MLLAASPADGDIGVTRLHPNVGSPGQVVDLGTGCGGARCPGRFPVSLVPSARAPRDHPCRGKALCSPEVAGPPRKRPFVFLGWAEQAGSTSYGRRYELRFRVPRVRPDVYAFVIYCGGCSSGPGGSLITGTARGQLLRVGRGTNATSSGGTGTDRTWLIAGAAGILVIAAAATILWRRRARQRSRREPPLMKGWGA
jgi:hypothetical protein